MFIIATAPTIIHSVYFTHVLSMAVPPPPPSPTPPLQQEILIIKEYV